MSGWVRIDREALEDLVALAEQVGGVWRRGAVVALLTLAQDDAAHPGRPKPFPSRRTLCVRTGWGDWPMRQMLASDIWRDDHKPLPRSSQHPPKILPEPSQDPPAENATPAAIGPEPSQNPPKILPAPSQDPPKILHTRVEDPHSQPQPTPTVTTTSTNARVVPDLSAVPAEMQPDMRRLLDAIATRQTPPRTADAVHRWIGVNPLRAAKLFETWRQLPPITEVPDETRQREAAPPPKADPTPARAEAAADRPEVGPAADGAGGDRPGRVDPDIGTRRVAPARWDDSDAWHEAVGLYVDIAAALLPEARPAHVAPSDPAGVDIGRGLEALGGRYVQRLAAILAALRGERAPAVAHEVARLARDLWVLDGPKGPATTLATLRRPKPAPRVAAIDAEIAHGAPLVPMPAPRVAGRQESPLQRYLRECDQREGVIDGQ